MRLAVIENAGYQGECVRKEFASWREAEAWTRRHYSEAERDSLHVDIAHWDAVGEFWSYDH